ncbi:MAG: transcription termination factor Rho [Cloacibacillus evryensis]
METPAAPEAAAEADEITPEAALLAQASDGAAAAEEGGKGKEEKDEELAIAKEIEAAAETQDGAEAEAENAPEDNRNLPVVDSQKNDRGQIRHQHPKLGFNQLAGQTLAELRKIAKEIGVSSITTRRKDDLINDILKTRRRSVSFQRQHAQCMSQDTVSCVRRDSSSSNDIYVSASQIRRFGLRNGDVVWGIIRPPKDQEHYEALLRVENVNFTDPEAARRRPHFEALTPIFPTEKLELETDRKQIATRIVDIFAPIGKGQRALIVSPPKAGKTTLLKNLAHSITTNHPEVILMVLLIDERPEEVTDMARSVDGEIIASAFDRPAEEHLRVAGLPSKGKTAGRGLRDVVLLLDSITRLARASNLIVPPRTHSPVWTALLPRNSSAPREILKTAVA